jgi:hypothetical protein
MLIGRGRRMRHYSLRLLARSLPFTTTSQWSTPGYQRRHGDIFGAECDLMKNEPCQPGTLVHTVHCELYPHVTLSHMITILVEYINALHSCLNTTTFVRLSTISTFKLQQQEGRPFCCLTTFFSFSHLTFARSSHIRQTSCRKHQTYDQLWVTRSGEFQHRKRLVRKHVARASED